jgi:hypothetical protein
MFATREEAESRLPAFAMFGAGLNDHRGFAVREVPDNHDEIRNGKQ